MKRAFEVPKELDYAKLKLRVGFEIHQQLDTKAKLFCNCPTVLVEDEDLQTAPRIVRYLRATRSELGEVDTAAAFEAQRQRVFEYLAPPKASCLVELDEEPPHELNREALVIALAIAMAFNAKIVDEVHVMRKIVIDGSNTTGFQRTAIIALGGYIEDEEGSVSIQTIALEEDAARKLEEKNGIVVYSLDRLGIPLIEISTAPDIRSPQQAKRVAEKIGLLLRLTGRVKRGLGTIRQDINLSIEGSPKIEIKGVQRLELIPKVIENEVRRLVGLLMIRDELHKRGARFDEIQSQPIIDVTDIVKKCKGSKLIENALKKGARAYALKLPHFDGLLGVELQPNRRFGTELADYARQWAGVKGLIHSDELPAYGIEGPCLEELCKALNIGPDDAFVLILDIPEKAIKALTVVRDRAAYALIGIPKETRGANEDGTTRYQRPQPGAARMYPETDVPPIKITEELLEEARKIVPPKPEEKLKVLITRYSLSHDLARQIMTSEYLQLFEELVSKYRVDPSLLATVFTSIAGELRKEGVDITSIPPAKFHILAKAIEVYNLSKDAIKEALKILYHNATISDVNQLIEALNIRKIGLDDVRRIVIEKIHQYRDEIIKRGERAFSFIMGKVMSELRGKVEGKVVAQIVREEIDKVLKG